MPESTEELRARLAQHLEAKTEIEAGQTLPAPPSLEDRVAALEARPTLSVEAAEFLGWLKERATILHRLIGG